MENEQKEQQGQMIMVMHGEIGATLMVGLSPAVQIGVSLSDAFIEKLYQDRRERRKPDQKKLILRA